MIRIAAFLCAICAAFAGDCYARPGAGLAGHFVTPRVAYIEPKDQSTVDITDKAAVIFKWNKVPIPAGGVQGYRFRVYKGFSYEVVASKNLDSGVFETEVPSGAFRDGLTYTWKVQQRDASSMNWSQYDTWSFKVVKKNP